MAWLVALVVLPWWLLLSMYVGYSRKFIQKKQTSGSTISWKMAIHTDLRSSRTCVCFLFHIKPSTSCVHVKKNHSNNSKWYNHISRLGWVCLSVDQHLDMVCCISYQGLGSNREGMYVICFFKTKCLNSSALILARPYINKNRFWIFSDGLFLRIFGSAILSSGIPIKVIWWGSVKKRRCVWKFYNVLDITSQLFWVYPFLCSTCLPNGIRPFWLWSQYEGTHYAKYSGI